MAKLPSHTFRSKSKTGEQMTFQSSVTLDQDGTFNASIPDDLYETAGKMRGSDVAFTKPANAALHRVSGKRLDDVKNFIYAAMAEHLKVETTIEMVIVYGHTVDVAYSRSPDGGFHPNGYMADAATAKGGYEWGGKLSATTSSPLYQVGLGAKVFEKHTHTRESGSKVEWKRPELPNFGHESPMEKLNAFVGLSLTPSEGGGWQEMPYSDDAATFFYDAMIAMCKLADTVSTFLGDKETLRLAIQNRVGLLAPPQAASMQIEEN